MRAFPDAAFVFLLPPDMTELERRLRGRGQDSEETINLRLSNAAR
jgi:guanylate kinase